MVFFEEEGKGMRLLVPRLPTAAPRPGSRRRSRRGCGPERFAGGGFALGDWTDLDAARQGLTLRLGETGGLVVKSARSAGNARVLSSTGWDLSWMMRLLGGSTDVKPEQPLRLDGLPGGDYTVAVGTSSAKVVVTAGNLGESTID